MITDANLDKLVDNPEGMTKLELAKSRPANLERLAAYLGIDTATLTHDERVVRVWWELALNLDGPASSPSSHTGESSEQDSVRSP